MLLFNLQWEDICHLSWSSSTRIMNKNSCNYWSLTMLVLRNIRSSNGLSKQNGDQKNTSRSVGRVRCGRVFEESWTEVYDTTVDTLTPWTSPRCRGDTRVTCPVCRIAYAFTIRVLYTTERSDVGWTGGWASAITTVCRPDVRWPCSAGHDADVLCLSITLYCYDDDGGGGGGGSDDDDCVAAAYDRKRIATTITLQWRRQRV